MFPRLSPAVCLLIGCLAAVPTLSQSGPRDRKVAGAFAPVFYQALGDKPRSDYITNFDFDGDWRGDNNWDHADDKKFPLKAYVYYSVSETATHFFIHYAIFHPRDYKGGESKGRILSDLIREGVKGGTEHDPTGLLEEAGVAHENDLEGCLIVAAKDGNDLKRAKVVFVETLHHNDFSLYVPGVTAPKGFGLFRSEDGHPLLYVEPKGHGVKTYSGDEKQTAKKEFLIYKFKGKAEDPEQEHDGSVGYDLLPIKTTLWARALNGVGNGANLVYGSTHNYGQIAINVVGANGIVVSRKITVGKVGSAFFGNTGGRNMARPPWAWFDNNAREQPLGLWFFDPATIVKRDFRAGESFSTAYIRLPFWASSR
ncbi:MAG TPA: hypothetical protein VFV61_10985 [Pyrinomonadaceae bacterium]|nr:hypothetical protein [Pyrinomonadaceae bacterium]